MRVINSIFEVIRYWYYSINYPSLRHLGFPAHGLGLELRAKRCKLYWKDHLKQCLSAQQEWLDSMESGQMKTLWIIGAGRLYDTNLMTFERKFSVLSLLDADPLVLPIWKKQQKLLQDQCALSFQIVEITNSLDHWTFLLNEKLAQLSRCSESRQANWNRIIEHLIELPEISPVNPSSFLSLPHADAVLSLNILSQLPLVWQDWIEIQLTRTFGKEWVINHELEWLTAFSFSAKALIERHLSDLAESNAKYILILTDVEYCRYYKTIPFTASKYTPAPCTWDPENGWLATYPYTNGKGPIEIELIPALYGIDVLNFNNYFEKYEPIKSTQWLWHIAPLGIEDPSHGMLHRVAACSFRR